MVGYQQGDVILVRLDKFPDGVKKRKASERGQVLAEGEVSGHAHVLPTEVPVFVREDGTLYVQTDTPVELVHEEHHVQTIAPGIYEVRKVREVDPFTDEIRAVQD